MSGRASRKYGVRKEWHLLATASALRFTSQSAATVARLSGMVFLVLSSVAAFREVFRRDRVDFHKILGALCIYLPIGALWAMSFLFLEDFLPGSFSGLEGHEGHARAWRLLYFSFVTLTTLGFGDVLPLSVYSETLVFMEAVPGQFSLAVLVAGLIGAYLNDREKHHCGDSIPIRCMGSAKRLARPHRPGGNLFADVG